MNQETIELRQKIGKKIKAMRKSRNMPSGKLAQRINVSPSYITRMEDGKLMPTLKKPLAIAKEFQVNIIDFFQESILECDVFKTPDYKNILFQGQEGINEVKIFTGNSTHSENLKIFSYLTRYIPRSDPFYHRHKGWELIILRSGKLKILLHDENAMDKKEFFLENPFDILLFNAELPHSCIPVAEEQETSGISIVSDKTVFNQLMPNCLYKI